MENVNLFAELALISEGWAHNVRISVGKDGKIKEVESVETSQVQLSGARYRGLTPGGKQYEITAALANESLHHSDRLSLLQRREKLFRALDVR